MLMAIYAFFTAQRGERGVRNKPAADTKAVNEAVAKDNAPD